MNPRKFYVFPESAQAEISKSRGSFVPEYVPENVPEKGRIIPIAGYRGRGAPYAPDIPGLIGLRPPGMKDENKRTEIRAVVRADERT